MGAPSKEPPAPTPVPALRQPEQVEVKLGPWASLVCARNRAGTVRCASWWRGVPVVLRGPAQGIVAMALGADDVCLGQAGGTWWCARGPDDASPLPRALPEGIDLHPIPRLAGALEVALLDGGGCAWMRDGAVSCWGISAPVASARIP